MLAAGIDLEIPREWLDCEPLTIRTGHDLGRVFNNKYRNACYCIWVQIVARAEITLTECQISSPFDDDIVLPDEDEQLDRLGSFDAPILNSRLGNGLSLRPGQMIEGSIVGFALWPIPDSYPNGSRVNCNLTFLDQYDEAISHEVSLFVDRPATPKRTVSRTQEELSRADEGLYGRRPQKYPKV